MSETEKCASDGTRFKKGWAACRIVETPDGSPVQHSKGFLPPKMYHDLRCLKSGCKTEEVAVEWLETAKDNLERGARCLVIHVEQEFEINEETLHHLKKIE